LVRWFLFHVVLHSAGCHRGCPHGRKHGLGAAGRHPPWHVRHWAGWLAGLEFWWSWCMWT